MDNPFSNSKSFFDDIVNALAGRGYIDGSSWLQRPQTQPDGPPMPAGNPMQLPGGMPQQQPSPPPQQQAPMHYGSPVSSMPVGWQDKTLQQAPWGRMIPFQQSGLAIQQQMPGSAPMVAQGFQPSNLGTVTQNQPPQGMVGLRAYNNGLGRQPSHFGHAAGPQRIRMKIIVKPEAPKPEVVAEEVYVYSGEKNYEPPKVDPWIEEQK